LSLEALVFAGAAAAADDGAFDVLCFSQAANKNKLTTTAMNLIMEGLLAHLPRVQITCLFAA
jgi:hypothetical protein